MLSTRSFLGAVVVSVLLIPNSPAQDAPAPEPAPQTSNPGRGSNPGQGNPGTGNPGGMPGQQNPRNPFPSSQQDRNQTMEMPRSFFFSGKVMLDDGTPPPDSVT
ncbi:MAG: hypothetical protein H7Y20_06510, partial [Bryobacteraceae bacterium]|nr:hypothetical protein [Bryobacteraceae bacterium]